MSDSLGKIDVLILVGGKVDLASSRRAVKQEEAEEFQKQYNIPYHFETSSKSGFKTNEIFETLLLMDESPEELSNGNP